MNIAHKTGFMASMDDIVADIAIIDDKQAVDLDRRVRLAIAKVTANQSPLDLAIAYIDWLGHLAISPGKSTQLVQSFVVKALQLGIFSVQSLLDSNAPRPTNINERRFSDAAWQRWPFTVFSQTFLSTRAWLQEATSGIEGMRPDSEELVAFMAQQILETLSPANFPATNPEVIKTTYQEKGANLKRGLWSLLEDVRRQQKGKAAPGTEQFRVGEHLGITPGKVIYQNQLMEVIQYTPATAKVGSEPVMIVPPWIMKYYILDLSPQNSLVKYLVEQGKTVFMLSWKNPTELDRDLSFDDYLQRGLMQALSVVNAIVPGKKVHAVGYCIGGTLLSIGAAALAGKDDDRLKSVSLFAAQTDFTEAGEIRRFVSDSQMAFTDATMADKGYLAANNMGGAFSALRSSDLIWGPAVDRYLLGKEGRMNDLMAWNADGTRMPYRMHSEYLRQLYLNNDLAEGRYQFDGRIVSLADIQVPLFVVATGSDHVAPWRSVYKIHRLTNTELTFLLTSGGHNAGIISGPSHPRRSLQVHTRRPGDKAIDPATWIADTEVQPGSWWPVWNEWLDSQTASTVKPPAMGAAKKGYKALSDAPGEYVFG